MALFASTWPALKFKVLVVDRSSAASPGSTFRKPGCWGATTVTFAAMALAVLGTPQSPLTWNRLASPAASGVLLRVSKTRHGGSV